VLYYIFNETQGNGLSEGQFIAVHKFLERGIFMSKEILTPIEMEAVCKNGEPMILAGWDYEISFNVKDAGNGMYDLEAVNDSNTQRIEMTAASNHPIMVDIRKDYFAVRPVVMPSRLFDKWVWARVLPRKQCVPDAEFENTLHYYMENKIPYKVQRNRICKFLYRRVYDKDGMEKLEIVLYSMRRWPTVDDVIECITPRIESGEATNREIWLLSELQNKRDEEVTSSCVC
jgi:hypothetical protein